MNDNDSDGFDQFDDSIEDGLLDAVTQVEIELTIQPTRGQLTMPARSQSTSALSGSVQRTLFGNRVADSNQRGSSSARNTRISGAQGANSNLRRTNSLQSSQSFLQRSPKTWEKTLAKRAAAQPSSPKVGKKRKRRVADHEEEDELAWPENSSDGEMIGIDLPEQLANSSKAKEVTHKMDTVAMTTWIYPTNKPLRDYQFNIVQKALLTNVLVAIPTGLGKTFIAAVVMYNFYRWFPKGKIVFVAPTRPLVAQQMDACYYTCNIPMNDTVELTGRDAVERRAQQWREKRVFFMTPQTLENDLSNRICNPRDFVCVVVDEAHRATGDYAYCGVVRRLKAQNENFRLLALSATPGRTIDVIQDVVDNLHIGKIEIRTESSIDIQPYIFDRCITPIVCKLCSPVTDIRDSFCKVIKPYLDSLIRIGAYYEKDPSKASHFGLLKARGEFRSRIARSGGTRNSETGMAEGAFAICTTLVHAMELLLKHGIVPFYKSIKQNIIDEAAAPRPKGRQPPKYKTAITNAPDFQSLVMNLESIIADPAILGHPKLERLSGLVLQHFQDVALEQREPGEESRVIIFSEFRDSVDEIVRVLNLQQPIIKPIRFVGQAPSKGTEGVKGYKQKEQLQVIKDFKKGMYNTLVSTSIGEEGLDIGQVDLIILYDCHGSSIRMVQRMGRTGRKRHGNVIALMTEGKEEASYHTSKDNYKYIQEAIHGGTAVRFFDDVPRMVPLAITPVHEKVMLDIPDKPATQEDTKKRKGGKIVKDPKRNIPNGIEAGFQRASELRAKRKSSSAGGNIKVPDDEAFLSEQQQAEFDEMYNQVDGFALDKSLLPTQLLRLCRTESVSHSDSTRLLSRWFKKSRDLKEFENTEEGEEWESLHGMNMSKSLDMTDVQVEKRQRGVKAKVPRVSATCLAGISSDDFPSVQDLIKSTTASSRSSFIGSSFNDDICTGDMMPKTPCTPRTSKTSATVNAATSNASSGRLVKSTNETFSGGQDISFNAELLQDLDNIVSQSMRQEPDATMQSVATPSKNNGRTAIEEAPSDDYDDVINDNALLQMDVDIMPPPDRLMRCTPGNTGIVSSPAFSQSPVAKSAMQSAAMKADSPFATQAVRKAGRRRPLIALNSPPAPTTTTAPPLKRLRKKQRVDEKEPPAKPKRPNFEQVGQFYDLSAGESDIDGAAPSDGPEAEETLEDLSFISEGGELTQEAGQSTQMQRIYAESLRSPAFVRPAAYSMKYNAAPRFMSSSQPSNARAADSQDEYETGSFVVGDSEVEYESSRRDSSDV